MNELLVKRRDIIILIHNGVVCVRACSNMRFLDYYYCPWTPVSVFSPYLMSSGNTGLYCAAEVVPKSYKYTIEGNNHAHKGAPKDRGVKFTLRAHSGHTQVTHRSHPGHT